MIPLLKKYILKLKTIKQVKKKKMKPSIYIFSPDSQENWENFGSQSAD